ncbi:hypothetical protein A9404_04785 [Halothiobacillus diazotrophicus]|uniref:Uncharacterized protein n=1 Tax=Halothiobacillus diazotrophicus TaxID=1860122 RepID=A0A191ZFZ9_9GAMM|nr:hypothetical protein [Halothiobacillus diazotrophicus]ANJ66780.1 hypothetical protein A9404_04785 [Halothiobacillus diazotrophicus]
MSETDQDTHRYSVAFSVLFWLLWLLGAGIGLVYLTFAVMILDGGQAWRASLLGPWNLLISMAEGIGLFLCALWFVRGAKSATELLGWVLVTVLVIPLIGFGGCVMSAQ